MEMIYSCVMGCEVEYEPPIEYDAYDELYLQRRSIKAEQGI